VTIINSTFVIRFKSGKTRQKTTSQAATIHSANVVHHKKKLRNNMIKIRLVGDLIEKKEYSNYEDSETYPSSTYSCDSCGEQTKFNLKDLDKHRFSKYSNLNQSDQKIMDRLILSMIPKSKIKQERQIWVLTKKDRLRVYFNRVILRFSNLTNPFPPIPKTKENIPDSYIDFYCQKCNRPVRIYYISYIGGKHVEHGYELKYLMD